MVVPILLPRLSPMAKAAAGRSRSRSPSYPSVGLPDAVDRATKLYAGVGTAGASPDAAAKLIGYSKNHGTARMTASALKKFGLIEERNGRLTPTKLTVDLANFQLGGERHTAALRQAALSPAVYRETFARYRPHGVLPPDTVLGPELVSDAGFPPDKVDGFLKDFRDSLTFAGLLRGNQLVEPGDPPGAAAPAQTGPAVGDAVRWETDGDGEEPDEHEGVVQGLSEDGAWAFVAGYGDGVPVADLTAVPPEDAAEIVEDAPPLAPANPFAGAGGRGRQRTEAFALAEGDAVLHRPDSLSAESLDELAEWLELVMKKLRRLREAADRAAE